MALSLVGDYGGSGSSSDESEEESEEEQTKPTKPQVFIFVLYLVIVYHILVTNAFCCLVRRGVLFSLLLQL